MGRVVHVINVYERCGHACAYCYAEWKHSPPTVVARENFLQKALRDLRKFYWGRKVILNLGSATDPYQPVEAKLRHARLLALLLKGIGATFYVCTKSDLVLRDLDVYQGYERAWIGISIANLDPGFSKVFEPNAPPPDRRLDALKRLLEDGAAATVRVSPIIPLVNDGVEETRGLVRELARVGVKAVTADVAKLDRSRFILDGWEGAPKWKRPLGEALVEWGEGKRGEKLREKIEEIYYLNGESLYGYVVPNKEYRRRILMRIKEACDEFKIRFSTCRMGVELKRELSTWIEEGKYRCACYVKEPTPIGKFPIEKL